uniref:Uncharacterized protein n=1 Tax=Rhizophora mucronata TaxID=61149 RepID=A0A2P2P283_RHIMU
MGKISKRVDNSIVSSRKLLATDSFWTRSHILLPFEQSSIKVLILCRTMYISSKQRRAEDKYGTGFLRISSNKIAMSLVFRMIDRKLRFSRNWIGSRDETSWDRTRRDCTSFW